MAIKDITSAVGPSAATEIDQIHYLEEDASQLDTLISDPRGFLKKNRLPVTDHSQVQTTVIRRPPVGAAAPARIRVVVIVAHFSNCDTVIVVLVGHAVA
jgi:hypothetical protein